MYVCKYKYIYIQIKEFGDGGAATSPPLHAASAPLTPPRSCHSSGLCPPAPHTDLGHNPV